MTVKIKNYFLSVLLLMLTNTGAFAAQNLIGWTLDGELPAVSQSGNSYRLTYTLNNNHPKASIPITTVVTPRGNDFSVVDSCNGATLAPAGQDNNTCTILISYSPSSVEASSIKVEFDYGNTKVVLPLQSTSVGFGSAQPGRLIGYMPGYLAPSTAQALFTAGYTHIIVAFGVFSTNNPGKITSAFGTVTPALIQQMKKLGIKVLLSLGGASSNIPNTTVNFHTALAAASTPAAFQAAFIASLESLMTQYGFDGFDFDIEFGLSPAGGGTITNPGGDIAVLAAIINQMHTLHPTVLLTLAPQTVNISANSAFSGTFANYSSLVMQTASALSWVGIQIYNSGTVYGIDGNVYNPSLPTNPDASVALATDLLASWPQGAPLFFLPYVSSLNPSQVVIGYLAPNKAGQVDGNPPVIPVATIKRAVQCLRTGVAGANSCNSYVPPSVYAGIGGVFGWQTNNDQNNNFAFAKSLQNCVLKNNCS